MLCVVAAVVSVSDVEGYTSGMQRFGKILG